VQDGGDLLPAQQPLSDGPAALFMPPEPDIQGAQSPQHGVGVLGGDRPADVHHAGLQAAGDSGLPGRRRTHEGIGVSAHILGQRLDRDIHAVIQRLEEMSCAPGVVDETEDSPGPGRRREAGHILHLKAQ
jgi:hypothetical protein